MTTYYKLVRDKIPEMIQRQGERPAFIALPDDRYIDELDKKLMEEAEEYQQSKELEELADILEVIYAICDARGYSLEELNSVREEKRHLRGGFSKKYFLLSKEEINKK